jgi:hypothetical protein
MWCVHAASAASSETGMLLLKELSRTTYYRGCKKIIIKEMMIVA